MFCRNCGLQQTDDAVFCEYCGVRLQQQTSFPAQPEILKEEQKRLETDIPKHLYGLKQPKKRSASVYVLLSLVVMFIFAFVVIFGIMKLYAKKNDADIIMKISAPAPSPTAKVTGIKEPAIFDGRTSLLINPDNMEPVSAQSTFNAASPQIYVTFKVKDTPAGSVIKVELTYDKTLLNVWAAVIKQSPENMQCSFVKPAVDWLRGVYEVRISSDGKYLSSIIFAVK